MSCLCSTMGILGDCAAARKIKSNLIGRLLEGVLKMWQGPSTVNTVGSAFCGDNLDESDSKIKGNSVRIINNMVDRI